MKIPQIYYISQGKNPQMHLENIMKMADCGVDWIQLRMKNYTKKEVIQTALKACEYCKKKQVTFIVNDNPEIAKEVGADGVHLGKEDKNPIFSRNLLGDKKIIGGTANTWQDCQQRIEEGVDYIGLGPYRFTTTKENLSPILGLKGYAEILQKLKENDISIPVVAIGGITLEDVKSLVKIGISGVALSSFLHRSEYPKEIISEIKSLF